MPSREPTHSASRAPQRRKPTKAPQKIPIVIAVMGPTGTGKSNLIQLASGKDVGVGHSLTSYTQEIREISCHHPSEHYEIRFVDTPGFDQTYENDFRVLNQIVKWLIKRYKDGVKLSGVIYTHRITDNRMDGSAIRTLDLFQKICGTDISSNIRLVTTHWDEGSDGPHDPVYCGRETELCEAYWKPLIDKGSRALRFNNDKASVWNIVDSLPLEPLPLQIQEEIVDRHLSLKDTAAGRTFSWFWDVLDSLKRVLRQIGSAF